MGTIQFRAEISQTIDIEIPVDGLEEMQERNFQNLTNPEILELLDMIIQRGDVVGMDLVEVAPDYDLTFSTSTLAAQLLMNAIGNTMFWSVGATRCPFSRKR